MLDRMLSSCSGKKVVPALGLAWSNAVTVRLLVMRTPYTLSQIENSSTNNDEASSVVCVLEFANL